MTSQALLITVISVAAVLALIGVIALVFAVKARHAAQRMVAVALQMEHEIEQLSCDLDKSTQRANDAALRLARIEARRGTNAASDDSVLAEAAIDEPISAKTSITERRHRVLSLARRGLDTKDISTTLGVPHGEVDLIIELSKVA